MNLYKKTPDNQPKDTKTPESFLEELNKFVRFNRKTLGRSLCNVLFTNSKARAISTHLSSEAGSPSI